MPVVVDASGASALVGRIVRVSSTRATVQRIDDATFGVGAQLVQGDGNGPTGAAEGQQASNLLQFSVIGNSGTLPHDEEGRRRRHARWRPGASYPHGLVIGTVVRAVSAGGAISRDADLRPVVDLDSLTFVKVLPKTRRSPRRDPSHPPRSGRDRLRRAADDAVHASPDRRRRPRHRSGGGARRRLRGRPRHRRDLRVHHGARGRPVPHHPARPLGALVRDHRLRGRRVPGGHGAHHALAGADPRRPRRVLRRTRVHHRRGASWARTACCRSTACGSCSSRRSTTR